MLKVIRITLEQEYSFVSMLLYWIWTGFCTMSNWFLLYFFVVIFISEVIIARYPINKSMLKVIRITLEQEYSFVLMLFYWIWTGFCTMSNWFLLFFFVFFIFISVSDRSYVSNNQKYVESYQNNIRTGIFVRFNVITLNLKCFCKWVPISIVFIVVIFISEVIIATYPIIKSMLKIIGITLELEYSFVLILFYWIWTRFCTMSNRFLLFFVVVVFISEMIIARYPINKSMLKVIRITLEQEYSFVLMLFYWIWTGFCTMSTDFYCLFLLL